MKKDIEHHDVKNFASLISRAFEAYHGLYKLEDESDSSIKGMMQEMLRLLIADLKMLKIIAYDNKDNTDLIIDVVEHYYYEIKHHFLHHILGYCQSKKHI